MGGLNPLNPFDSGGSGGGFNPLDPAGIFNRGNATSDADKKAQEELDRQKALEKQKKRKLQKEQIETFRRARNGISLADNQDKDKLGG